MKFGPQISSLQTLAETVTERQWREESFATMGVENWQKWWDALAQEAELADLLAERERRFDWHLPDNHVNAGRDLQVAALTEAGFREVGIIWQRFDNCVLMAVR